jgi:hypothetical protein
LLNYPVFDAGWMMAPRGFGTMLAMFIVARMINRLDNRLFILVGFLMTAASLWQMSGYSLYMGPGRYCGPASRRVLGSAAPSCRSTSWRCRACRTTS